MQEVQEIPIWMKERLRRYQTEGCLHLITFSSYQRLPYLHAAEARECFERSLEMVRVRYGLAVIAYVVMPEHVHLLVSEPERCLLSAALHGLKLSVAKRRPERPFSTVRYHDSMSSVRGRSRRRSGVSTGTR